MYSYPPPNFLPVYNSRGHNATNDQDMFDDIMGIQRETATLGATNEATWTFAYSFAAKPAVAHMYEESADNLPVILKVKSFTQDGNGRYTGVTVKGYRFQNLPVLNNVSGLLTAVIDGVNSLVTALSGRSVISSASLSGLVIHLEAGKRNSS